GIKQVRSSAKPVLQLKMLPHKARGRHEPSAVLQFQYADYLLPLNLTQAQTELSDNGASVFIQRDRAAETAALEQLLQLELLQLPTLAPPYNEQAVFGVGEGPDNPLLWQPLLDALPQLEQQG